jgi:hypothetical protein
MNIRLRLALEVLGLQPDTFSGLTPLHIMGWLCGFGFPVNNFKKSVVHNGLCQRPSSRHLSHEKATHHALQRG